MKAVKQHAKNYQALKNKLFPNIKERIFIRDFERALNDLNNFDRSFFIKTFLQNNKGEEEWWRKYYARTTFFRMRDNIAQKFLDKLKNYDV